MQCAYLAFQEQLPDVRCHSPAAALSNDSQLREDHREHIAAQDLNLLVCVQLNLAQLTHHEVRVVAADVEETDGDEHFNEHAAPNTHRSIRWQLTVEVLPEHGAPMADQKIEDLRNVWRGRAADVRSGKSNRHQMGACRYHGFETG